MYTAKQSQAKESMTDDYVAFKDNIMWMHLVPKLMMSRLESGEIPDFLRSPVFKVIEMVSDKGFFPFQRRYAQLDVVPDEKKVQMYGGFLRDLEAGNLDEITLDNLTYNNRFVLKNTKNLTEFCDGPGQHYLSPNLSFDRLFIGDNKYFMEGPLFKVLYSSDGILGDEKVVEPVSLDQKVREPLRQNVIYNMGQPVEFQRILRKAIGKVEGKSELSEQDRYNQQDEHWIDFPEEFR